MKTFSVYEVLNWIFFCNFLNRVLLLINKKETRQNFHFLAVNVLLISTIFQFSRKVIKP